MIRDFEWTDIPAACAIEGAAFPHDTWSPESFWGELARSATSGHYFAADVDGDLVGYAGVAFAGDDAHLQTLAVAMQGQGRGTGRALLDAVLARAAANNAHRCLLEVKPDNEPAIELYASVGFARFGTRPDYYPGGEAALVMEVELRSQTCHAQGDGRG